MNASDGIQEGQLTTRPPLFNCHHFSWWKKRMEIFIKAVSYEVWKIVEEGPLELDKERKEDGTMVTKDESKWDANDYRKLEKNALAIKLLHCALGPDEFNRISDCDTAKEIWDSLIVAHEGNNQVKQYKIELLTRQYELFSMQEKEPIKEMYTRFMNIVNELKSLGKKFTTEDLVRKVLRVLLDTKNWFSKVIAIQEAKDLSQMTMDQLIDNLSTHELFMNSKSQQLPKRETGIAFKRGTSDDEIDEDLVALAKKFKKFLQNSTLGSKKGKSTQNKQGTKTNRVCNRCGSPDHLLKDCSLWEENRARNPAKEQASGSKDQQKEQYKDQQTTRNPAKEQVTGSRGQRKEQSRDQGQTVMIGVWGDTDSEDD